MKLIIQIPCLNEEKTLPDTIADLPKSLPGVDVIEWLIVDDGSTDRTVQVAREHGVHHVVSLTNNKGLAEAFLAGLDAGVKLGADIIVNTDGDNQYQGGSVGNLISPILQGKADIVIGCRPIEEIEHFSFVKKRLQKIGSWVVRQVSSTDIPDTTSGFRAYSREAALRLNVISRFTYTIETIIQAGKRNMAITHVPIQTNGKLRESRLFASMPSYIKRTIGTMFRIYTMYEPLKTFSYIGSILLALGLFRPLLFVYDFFINGGKGQIQSLILSVGLLLTGTLFFFMGVIADLIAGHRRLTEDTLYRVKQLEFKVLQQENEELKRRYNEIKADEKQAS